MARTSTYPLVDRLLDGKLAETLTAWQNQGDGIEEITWRLRSEYDVPLSTSTVRRWLDRIKTEAAA